MKVYNLENGQNYYGMLDRNTGYDYHYQRFVEGAKSRIRTDDGQPIGGCIYKVLYDLEKISMLMVTMEPCVASPADGYICHTGVEEITFVLSGKGHLEFPDGKKYDLVQDQAFMLKPGQPHRVINDSTEVLKYYVVYSTKLENVPRDKYMDGTECDSEIQYKNINECMQKLAPGFTGNAADAGHYTSIIFEGENICFLHPLMCSNSSSPEEDFVSHPGVDELECLISGKLSVIMPDRAYTLTPEIIRYNNPEQPSKNWNNYTEDARLLVFYSTGKIANVYRTHKHAVSFWIQN